MNSGFEDDEAYNVYSEAWRKGSNIGSNIYRPTKNADKDMYGGEDLDELRKTNRFHRTGGKFEFCDRPIFLHFLSGSSRTRSSAGRNAARRARPVRRRGRGRCSSRRRRTRSAWTSSWTRPRGRAARGARTTTSAARTARRRGETTDSNEISFYCYYRLPASRNPMQGGAPGPGSRSLDMITLYCMLERWWLGNFQILY